MKPNFTGSINGTQYDDFDKFLNDLHQIDREKQINVAFNFETASDKTDTKERDLSKKEIIKKELVDEFEPTCNIYMLRDSSFCGREIQKLDQDIYDKCKKFDKFLKSACQPLKIDVLKFINERIFCMGAEETQLIKRFTDLQTENKEIQSEEEELLRKYKELTKKKKQCEQEISNLTGIKIATFKINSYWRALKQTLLNDLNN